MGCQGSKSTSTAPASDKGESEEQKDNANANNTNNAHIVIPCSTEEGTGADDNDYNIMSSSLGMGEKVTEKRQRTESAVMVDEKCDLASISPVTELKNNNNAVHQLSMENYFETINFFPPASNDIFKEKSVKEGTKEEIMTVTDAPNGELARDSVPRLKANILDINSESPNLIKSPENVGKDSNGDINNKNSEISSKASPRTTSKPSSLVFTSKPGDNTECVSKPMQMEPDTSEVISIDDQHADADSTTCNHDLEVDAQFRIQEPLEIIGRSLQRNSPCEDTIVENNDVRTSSKNEHLLCSDNDGISQEEEQGMSSYRWTLYN